MKDKPKVPTLIVYQNSRDEYWIPYLECSSCKREFAFYHWNSAIYEEEGPFHCPLCGVKFLRTKRK